MTKHWVLTGCIAKHLLDLPRHSYKLKPGEHRTGIAKQEMTRSYAQLMASRVKGKPFMVEHQYEHGPVGEVLYSWVDDRDGWMGQFRIDSSSIRGLALINAVLRKEAKSLSLGHNDDEYGVRPAEVSLVTNPARPDSDITEIRLVDDEELSRIKSQVYKPIIRAPLAFQSQGDQDFEAPSICCSLDEAVPVLTISMAANPLSLNATHTAVRQPAPPTKYIESLSDFHGGTGQEIQKILDRIDGSRAKPPLSSQQKPQQYTEAELTQMLQELRAKSGTTGTPPPVQPTYEQRQMNDLTQKLQTVASNKDPSANGNIHTIYTDPSYEPVMALNDLVDSKLAKTNILSRPEIDSIRQLLTGVATERATDRDTIAKLTAEYEKLKADVQAHERDKRAMELDTAALFLEQSGMSKEDVAKFSKLRSEGQDKPALDSLVSAMVKCSADRNYMPAVAQDEQMPMEDDEEAHAHRHQLEQILKSEPRHYNSYKVDKENRLGRSQGAAGIQASAGRGYQKKRSAAELANSSNQASVSPSAGQSWVNSGVPSSLMSLFASVDKGLSTTDKVVIPKGNNPHPGMMQ